MIEDEYEIRRDRTVYQTIVEYEWCRYPHDEEGCPIVPKGAPMVTVISVEVLASWLDGEPEGADDYIEYGSPYPPIVPELTAEELRAFDEHLADKAAGAAEPA